MHEHLLEVEDYRVTVLQEQVATGAVLDLEPCVVPGHDRVGDVQVPARLDLQRLCVD